MLQRAPSETVQVNLRIKESFRRRLERSAEKGRVSLNAEMVRRLKESYRNEDPLLKAVIAKYQRQGRVLQGWLESELRARGLDDENAREVAAIAKAYLG
jgi:hypothetical protein